MLPVFLSLVSIRPQRCRVLLTLLGLVIGGLSAMPLQAQVYASAPADDEAAPLVLSNFASEDTPRLVIDAPLPAPASARAIATAPTETDAGATPPHAQAAVGTHSRAPGVPAGLLPWFRHVGREQAVPVSLLLAVAAAESGFNPRARSPKGAQGLMQLMPGTARELGVRQVWSVGDNLRGGAAYLRSLLQRFSGDLSLALAAYNAGEGAVQRAGNRIPDYEETRLYVPKVLAWQRHYQGHDMPDATVASKKSMAPLKTTTAAADSARIRTP